jgi:hypothetical protein
MIARLAAKALILELEHCKIPRIISKQVRFEQINDYSKSNHTNIKQRIIDLSLRYNILSPYTVFIGIEKHLNESVQEVPIQILTDRLIPIHVERLLSKTSALTNDNNACYYRKRDRLEHVQLHHDMFTPVRSSTTNQTRSSILLNQRKFREYHVQEKDEISPMDDKNIVDYLINKQTTDGLWSFNSNRKTIQKLTGKSLSIFQSSEIHDNSQILITAIIIVLFEVKFITLRSMWDDAVEKARQCLIQLLNNDWRKLVILFRDIRMILTG